MEEKSCLRNPNSITPVSTARNRDTRSIIDTIRAMPDIYRTVLEMRFVEERSTKEIAKALSLKETTVDVRIHRGRALLIRKLREEGYIK